VHIDKQAFFGIMSSFPSGVTVVTTIDADGCPLGLTSTAVCSVSADPPLLLVSVAETSQTLPWLTATRRFAVNILQADAAEVSNRFAARSDDKFTGLPWSASPSGMPILEAHVLAWADCELESELLAGDHRLLLGRVLDGAAIDGAPLVYFRREYSGLIDAVPAA
jgi:flavin reductase (DIM6/NTAB) family NADH-FMN oxidoreductase RutF